MKSAYYPTYIGLSRSIAVCIYPALAQLVATSKMLLLPWTVFADVIKQRQVGLKSCLRRLLSQAL